MLFKLKFDITYEGGATAHVETRPATDVAFERKFGVTVASMFAGVPTELGVDNLDAAGKATAMQWLSKAFTTEQTSYLAWSASRDTRDFDTWLDTVASIEWGFAGVVDPTRPAASAS